MDHQRLINTEPPAGRLLPQERARNKFSICGPVVSERFFCLTPEGSRSVARGILPLEGIRRPPLPTSAPDGAEMDVLPLIQGRQSRPWL